VWLNNASTPIKEGCVLERSREKIENEGDQNYCTRLLYSTVSLSKTYDSTVFKK
jgi:hypothetical protein